ncbi:uncharacterized protein KY384_000014 [Bacidia gigantensis]|uniref:uncharacterized protein n=1 Tax=Bacidia gigantensis TaxID=2732470 RepID=UPI001D05926E|nr:uncharacterized protein KY384_000014 [Bacidia gigantensis]KAG8526421.1 hypothetical protein KY384_000014 [Bacidia gigantensis]
MDFARSFPPYSTLSNISNDLTPYISDSIEGWIASVASSANGTDSRPRASSAPPFNLHYLRSSPHSNRDPTTPAPSIIGDETPSSKKTRTYHPAHEVALQLRNDGLVLDEGHIQKYPIFWGYVCGFVESERASAEKLSKPTKQKEQKVFSATIKATYDFEDTYLTEALSLLMKDRFEASEESAAQIQKQAQEEAGQWHEPDSSFNLAEENEWKKYGLMKATKVQFKKKLVPAKHKTVMLAVKEYKGNTWALKDPVPDRTIGLHIDFLDGRAPERLHRNADVWQLFNLCPAIQHPFAVLEGKGTGGNITEMHSQGIRDSATVIAVHRELRHKYAGLTDDGSTHREDDKTLTSYPDWETFVFCFTLSSESFEVYICWAEVFEDGPVLYHMDTIETLNLKNKNSRERGSRWLHNVIEWGLFKRTQEIRVMRRHIYDKELTKQKQSPLTDDELKQMGVQDTVSPAVATS